MMNVQIEVGRALCEPSTFVINGVIGDSDDFGKHVDHDPDNAPEDYGCGDMHFEGRPSTPAVLAKYGITEAEYQEVRARLEKMLSFGDCGMCI